MEGVCVGLWLDKQEKETGQTNRGKRLMVSQSALSGGEKNYKDEENSFKAFHFKRKMSVGGIFTMLMMFCSHRDGQLVSFRNKFN